jgi:hypothetical protein
VLRSTALTILGTAGIAAHEILVNALQQVMVHAASGELRIDTECVPLEHVESAWERDPQGRRLIITPSP